jgi:putative ABC transport system permease protein
VAFAFRWKINANVMKNLLRDGRIGLRLLGKAPSFAGASILTLAIGIAANTAIFSVIYATFFEPLPYRDAEHLVMVWSQQRGERIPASPAEFVEWKRQAASFEDLNAWSWWHAAVSVGDAVEQLLISPATTGYLPMLGYGHPLALGRDFLESEGTPGNGQVVIITHRIWRDRFALNPNVIGQQIRIDRKPYTVVGVLAAGPPDENEGQLWVPLSFTEKGIEPNGSGNRLLVMGRLRRDVTLAQADASLDAVTRNMRRSSGGSSDERAVTVQHFRNNFLSADTRRGLWLLLAAVAFVLLIACANVANLMLARGTARQRELAIRTSLGASRSQIAGQMLVESSLVAVVGGAVGVALAWALLKIVIALMPADMLPTEAHVRLNVPVLLFTFAACGLAGVLCGAAPAWQAARANVNELLKDAARSVSATGNRVRRVLVVIEFALAVTLLTGGGLAIYTLFELANRDLGFRRDHLLTFMLPIGDNRFSTSAQIAEFYRQILERLQAVPGVVQGAVSVDMPLRSGMYIPFSIAGRAESEPSKQLFAGFNMVTPSYFDAFAIRIVRGRTFTDRDRAGAVPVAIINETLARRYLADVDPLTQRVVMPQLIPGQRLPGPMIEYQIVGVRSDIRDINPANDAAPAIEVPFWQSPWPFVQVALQTAGDPASARQDVAAVIRSIDPDLPMGVVRTGEQLVSELLVSDRFNSALFGGFALVALVLAAVGVYSVMSFGVARRTQEIGVRMALGADRMHIVRRVVGEGMTTAATGAAIGSLGAFYAARLMRGLVTGMPDLTPVAFIIVTTPLLVAAFVACLVPAVRAASVDPLVALRRE